MKFAAQLLASFTLAGLCCLSSMAQQTPSSSSTEPSSQSSTTSDSKDAAKPDPAKSDSAKSDSVQPGSTPQKPADASGQSDKGDKKDKGKDAGTSGGTSNDRLFFALPNFLTLENGGKVPPLTAQQKFGVVARSAFDYVQVPWYAFLSGLSQAEDSEPGYGQGWEGYGKRFASAAADGTIENFMVGAVLPSVLHQDPRFFQLSGGSFAHRAGYAVTRIVVTRTDSGHAQFNYSEIFGSALSASISTYSYHPRSKIISTPTGPRYIASDRTLTNTASVWASQLGYDTITIVIKEFWPDIHRKLSHKHEADAMQSISSKP